MTYELAIDKVIDYHPEAIRNFHATHYECIDNLHFVHDPKEFLQDPLVYIDEAEKRLLKAGWRGNGEIGLIWVPPFSIANDADLKNRDFGVVLWHVKQIEDGLSYLLSPIHWKWLMYGALR